MPSGVALTRVQGTGGGSAAAIGHPPSLRIGLPLCSGGRTAGVRAQGKDGRRISIALVGTANADGSNVRTSCSCSSVAVTST